ncbi:hypothetical protein FSP39_013647 [Pinctada imbricata]|uniref:C2H2-type domain-containing protein n=1 Tax=Pinctada imbricata TaxID=66713 RepID=A0AA88Y7R1_PINIB|nr:hypothetical protein FSP39_013647 [Pinctada imbricata]
MPGCNKRYTDPSSLRKHVRTHGHYFRSESDPTNSRSSCTNNNSTTHHTSLTSNTSNNSTANHLSLSSIPSTKNNQPTQLNGLASNSVVHQTIGPVLFSVHNLIQPVASNPLLSSALLTTGCSNPTRQSHTDNITNISPTSPFKLDLQAGKLSPDEDDKSHTDLDLQAGKLSPDQDGPLDLTTSPAERLDDSHVAFTCSLHM